MENKKIQIVDATCPFVKKIHNIVQKHSEMGENIIIIGNPEHPEVQGIKGWAGDHVEVFQTKEEAENYSCEQGKKICIVAQTTFNYNKFKELVEILEKKSYDVSVLNTICNATKERQTEAQSIAETVDAMIVIGDKHSSNTQKLFEICRKECKVYSSGYNEKNRNFKRLFTDSCHVNLFVRLHRCKNRYSGGNEALFAGEVRRRSKRK